MTFDMPPRRTPPESIVPMINVVFLLLIFFLMTAQITPPEPVEVTPPVATMDDPSDGDLTLFISADGTPAYDTAQGDAALAALFAAQPAALTIKADAAVPASTVAALLPRLAAAGFDAITLVTAAP
ncbi:outer membrane transport energization protein ExbD [Loktanella atrilutea]|uniref:Outer membrane transport energization protein ExbD n=1 Tax=Loktanella atrilutea TaxID=366533 RepID=A0A1M4XJK8_LOKAT|nr:biopolymer transporter ExbD [Loktanella atrilutea]SHE93566.1 outer membrane transport energization protein ExbD [Loktanella atrilutea]